MTTVAYMNGVMAADSAAYGGPHIPSPGFKNKVHRLKDGSLLGYSSRVIGSEHLLIKWLNAGAKPYVAIDKPEDFQAIVVRPNGDMYYANSNLMLSGPCDCEFYAIGSGSDFAIGAMAAGKTVTEALEIAIRFDPHSGGPIRVLKLKED